MMKKCGLMISIDTTPVYQASKAKSPSHPPSLHPKYHTISIDHIRHPVDVTNRSLLNIRNPRSRQSLVQICADYAIDHHKSQDWRNQHISYNSCQINLAYCKHHHRQYTYGCSQTRYNTHLYYHRPSGINLGS